MVNSCKKDSDLQAGNSLTKFRVKQLRQKYPTFVDQVFSKSRYTPGERGLNSEYCYTDKLNQNSGNHFLLLKLRREALEWRSFSLENCSGWSIFIYYLFSKEMLVLLQFVSC